MWLQFSTKEEFAEKESELYNILRDSDGNDEVIIYVANPKAIKKLGRNNSVLANYELIDKLNSFLGEKNVKVVEKNIENLR